jgi:RND family efflux transporter MFP subunit
MSKLLSIIRFLVTFVAVIGAFVAGSFLWRTYMESPWTRDARVRANVVMVAPDVSGAVVDLRVVDNQEVKIGDILFVIDQARFELALAQAEAELAAAQSSRDEREEEYDRKQKLIASSAISVESLRQARAAALSSKADCDRAQAAVDLAKLNLARTTVHSPVNGPVTNLLLNKGDYVTAGHPVLAVVDSDSFYVAGYFEETKLHAIAVGDRVAVRLLGFGEQLEGHVGGIARAITDRDNALGASLIADVNPTFNWVRLAQRVPVRIVIDHVPKEVTLSAGMTATVVVTGPGKPPTAASLSP